MNMKDVGEKIFGTDGVRCIANGIFMNPFFVSKLAFAIYKVMLSNNTNKKFKVIIAKDTRRSGYMIENALSSTFMALGAHVILVGPIPTPSLPFLISSREADIGFMISASHNHHEDNGIKIFAKNGFKISDENEKAIEKILSNENEFSFSNLSNFLANPAEIGTLSRIHNTGEQYSDFIFNKLKRDIKNDLSGMKIVVDCANGAAYKTANFLLNKLNAEVILINNKPNGLNINDNCGAIYPEKMSAEVVKQKADLGIALDGDGDRIVLCDQNGEIIDNDKLMAIIAVYYKKREKLQKNTLVATILSNKGMEVFLNNEGIQVHRTPVGDKHIAEAMKNHQFNFGGEKSGHIIFNDYSSSGDGLLTGAFIACILRESGLKASEIFQDVNLFPQITRNLPYTKNDSMEILNDDQFRRTISSFEERLGDHGRILVRKSGTEKKIRLMAEGMDLMKLNLILDSLTIFLNEIIF
jgi:phosphoglucosamine mutase